MQGWLIFFLSVAGHTTAWVMLVNRLHAFPIRAHFLRRFRTLHDVAVPAFPLLLATLTHFQPADLALTLQFSRFPNPLQLLVLLTAAFSLPLAAGILRWQLSGKHHFLYASHKQLVNLHKQAASLSPAAADAVSGIPKRLAKLWPWNEFLQLELNHKTLHIPGNSATPDQHPSLRILHFSDLHFTGTPGLEFYRRVVDLALQQPTDAVMFTGDLIDDPQLLQAAVEILKPLTQIAPCWFVLGNHDWRTTTNSSAKHSKTAAGNLPPDAISIPKSRVSNCLSPAANGRG